MQNIDVTVVVDTLGSDSTHLLLQRRGLSHEDRVKLTWGDATFYVNLSALRDAVKILGAV